ncbi:MAG TPA: bifunctional DNA-formamidopyrimidine glycosylase/DNA-(apurinic or apyrimidinic site) lyase [Chloroflexota bacterium]|nr:bifunctional DNA-formamidopyrimidine glycosylase/DNA-(apurinic or apyrimidinic site) lyase [Chloroflexota bacterium]
MPELPEVETMIRDLTPLVVGRTIEGVEAAFPGEVIWPSFDDFVTRVRGRTITSLSRRGKYAIFTLDSGDALIVHRGMTGSLLLRRAEQAMEPHVRMVFHLAGEDELRFKDPRKFGKAYVMQSNGAERPMPWHRMGPEPLNSSFSAGLLAEALKGRRALIKPLLLNQQVVAGLGNIYVDESLFRANIHPERRANTLTDDEMVRLHQAITEVLGEAVEGRGTTFQTYTDVNGRAGNFQRRLQVFGRNGQPCPRCGTPIIKTRVGGRGTYTCPTCQRP